MVESDFKLGKVKSTVVGDSFVGKTCLINSFGSSEFLQDHVPTVAANYTSNIEYNGEEIDLSIWDTAGQDDYKSVRPIAYNDTDCFIMCFSLSDPTSLENVVKKWKNEVEQLGPKNAARILVGCKSDLRDQMVEEG